MASNLHSNIWILILFGMLSSAFTYQHLSFTERLARHSRSWVWFVTLASGVALSLFVFLYGALIDRLPEPWGDIVSENAVYIFFLCGILKEVFKPRHRSVSEIESQNRIQTAVLIGGILLISFCAIKYWPN